MVRMFADRGRLLGIAVDLRRLEIPRRRRPAVRADRGGRRPEPRRAPGHRRPGRPLPGGAPAALRARAGGSAHPRTTAMTVVELAASANESTSGFDPLGAAAAKWTAIGLSTAPADRDTAAEAVRIAYTAVGLPVPKHVIWFDSP